MAERRRGSRTARAVPAPNEPQIGRAVLKRRNTESDYKNLTPNGVKTLLEKTEGMRDKSDRVRRSASYVEVLKSEDPEARSCDGLSKQEIVKKLNACVKAWWKTYDAAKREFDKQNVEAPAPAVEPEPEDLEALGFDAIKNLVTAREARLWAQNQSTKYENIQSIPTMRKLLRDQAADPTQWDLVAKHPAPAPLFTGETVSMKLTRGLQFPDTWAKWMSALTVGPRREAFDREEAPTALLNTLPTLKLAAKASQLRGAHAYQRRQHVAGDRRLRASAF